jgi:hypothetical protein
MVGRKQFYNFIVGFMASSIFYLFALSGQSDHCGGRGESGHLPPGFSGFDVGVF